MREPYDHLADLEPIPQESADHIHRCSSLAGSSGHMQQDPRSRTSLKQIDDLLVCTSLVLKEAAGGDSCLRWPLEFDLLGILEERIAKEGEQHFCGGLTARERHALDPRPWVLTGGEPKKTDELLRVLSTQCSNDFGAAALIQQKSFGPHLLDNKI